MSRQFPGKFVGFLLGTSTLALTVALVLPAFPLNGINNAAVAHMALVVSFALCVAALLELAIIYIPAFTGPQSTLLLLLGMGLAFAAWAVRIKLTPSFSANYPQQRSTATFPDILRSHSELRTPEDPATEGSHDHPSPTLRLPAIASQGRLSPQSEIRATQIEIPAAPNPPTETIVTTPDPCDAIRVVRSSHQSSSGCGPSKLQAISATQRNAIRDAMKPYAGMKFTMLSENPTDDSRAYADQIERALTDAGLHNVGNRDITRTGNTDSPGVTLVIGDKASDAANGMASGMRRAGLVLYSIPTSESFAPEDFQVIVAPNR
jgi:hypothetical protein